jgi:hypothetical protein
VAMVTLSDGRVYELPQGGGTIVTDGPAAARVEQLASMGQPRVITDNTEAIDDTDGGEGFACGCHGLDASIAALTLLPLLRLRRRR